jgi:hypothetical protein
MWQWNCHFTISESLKIVNKFSGIPAASSSMNKSGEAPGNMTESPALLVTFQNVYDYNILL